MRLLARLRRCAPGLHSLGSRSTRPHFPGGISGAWFGKWAQCLRLAPSPTPGRAVQECTFFTSDFACTLDEIGDCAESFFPEIEGTAAGNHPAPDGRKFLHCRQTTANLRVVIPSESLALSGVEWVEGSRCDSFPLRPRDSSTSLRSAQNDNFVFPDPRSMRPMRFARKTDIVLFASRSATTATMPIPILKT